MGRRWQGAGRAGGHRSGVLLQQEGAEEGRAQEALRATRGRPHGAGGFAPRRGEVAQPLAPGFKGDLGQVTWFLQACFPICEKVEKARPVHCDVPTSVICGSLFWVWGEDSEWPASEEMRAQLDSSGVGMPTARSIFITQIRALLGPPLPEREARNQCPVGVRGEGTEGQMKGQTCWSSLRCCWPCRRASGEGGFEAVSACRARQDQLL